MKSSKYIIAAALMAFSAMGAAADNKQFDAAVDMLVANNMRTRIEQSAGLAEVASLNAANELSPLEVEGSFLKGNSSEAGNKWAVSVSQGFDWPTIYAARRKAAESAATATQFLYESALLDARAEARTLVVDLIHANKMISLAEVIEKQSAEVEKYFRNAVEKGTETRIDLNKAVIDHVRTKGELIAARATREEVLTRIRVFNPNADINTLAKNIGDEYPMVTMTRLEDAMKDVRSRDPRYAAAKAQTQKARDLMKVADMSKWPGLSIGVEYENEIGGQFAGISAGISLPVWSRKHSVAAARYEAETAEMQAELDASTREAELAQNMRQIQQIQDNLNLYNEALQQTQNFQLVKKAFDMKTISLLHYLQETAYFMDAEKEYLNLQHEYQLAAMRQLYLE